MIYSNRLDSLFKLNNISDFQIDTLEKYIVHSIKIETFSRKYDFNSRYLEQADVLPSKWTKSWFRDSFAKSNGLTAELPFIKVKDCFLRNDKDFVLCLDENPRISVEISHGQLEYKKLYEHSKNIEDPYSIISDAIVIPHISTYNIWHHFVELITLANEIAKNSEIMLNKLIYIPEMEDTQELLSLLSIEEKVKTFPIQKNIILKNCYIVTGVFDEILPIRCLKNAIREIVNADEIKGSHFDNKAIFLSRGDKILNRRNLINEKDVISALNSKFSNLGFNRPGFGNLKENISKMINAEYAISLQGTQLYFNCLFMKNPKIIWEIVGNNYYGLTVGELAANFLDCNFIRSSSKNAEPGYSIYKDQIADMNSLKSNLDNIKI